MKSHFGEVKRSLQLFKEFSEGEESLGNPQDDWLWKEEKS